MLAQWWAQLDSGVGGSGVNVPGSSVGLQRVGLFPDSADGRFWIVLKLVLACW